MNQPKEEIRSALQHFSHGDLAGNARHLLNVLGYDSERRIDLEPNTADGFLSAFNLEGKINRDRALLDEWESVDLLFQLTEEEVVQSAQRTFQFGGIGVERNRFESYLFFALELSENDYSRTKLSQITREINKPFNMPAMILFKHGETLTFAVIDRRLHKRDESKDVLEKATFIKDINFADPHPAHIVILFDLSIAALHRKHQFSNFDELHAAWRKTLDTSELNKRFYREIADWYFWAVDRVTFPEDAGEDVDVRNAASVIRLITRLIFVWFIKEKNLVPNVLFEPEKIKKLLISTNPQDSAYYKAILQNLFFATLNQEMNTSEKPNIRKFRGEGRQHYNITSLHRYKRYFSDPVEALKLFETIPFLNGGLFECLDKPDKDDPKRILRIDGFSDRDDISLQVPNKLFFSEEHNVDLNAAYGTKGRGYKVRGLINILDRYKFTIAENTPIEEEVALDPELLGKVFENLLAAYNPETDSSARKQSGSYYTPREIVDYMTDESLIAYLKHKCIAYYESRHSLTPTTPPAQLDLSGRAEPVQTQIDTRGVTLSDEQKDRIEANLRNLFAYNDEPHRFNDDESEVLINAVDSLRILDPACGSGAFPMGVLHKLVFILGKLDPRNDRWRKRQIYKVNRTIETAEKIDDSAVRENTIRDLEHEIDNINEAFERNELDYGRKLYLIENCIYGVDIQPIAVQIAKLRFFISLVVDQKIDDSRANRGVRPLPNLETKFVAANTLIDITGQLSLRSSEISKRDNELQEVRRRHFTARTPARKKLYRTRDAELRAEISGILRDLGLSGGTAREIASWDPYDQNTTADFFNPEWMFGITDGFDVVIGNPPYVQLQKDGGRLGNLYASCNFDSFVRTGDIYCLFYEKANQLSRDGGHVCYITSNKWMRAAYGRNLRDYFIVHTQPIQLLDMGPDVFDATVDTNILLLQNVVPKNPATFKTATIKADFDKQTGNITEYMNDKGMSMEMPAKGEPWAILSPTELVLKRKIVAIGTPLKKWDIIIYRGIITGCNEAFLIDEAKRAELIARDPRSVEIIRPLLRGKDIKRYHVKRERLYLLATGHDLDIPNEYPAVYRHLETIGNRIESIRTNENRKGLFKRDDQGENWWNLRACAYYPEFEREKIVWQEMATKGTFLIDRSKYYSLDTTRIMTGKNLTYLVGILNSRFFLFAFKNYYAGGHLGSRGIRFKSEFMKLFPVPPITEANHHLAAQIKDRVDKIIVAKRSNPDADTTALENEIDQIVYSLYALTADEIKVVEEATE